MASRLGIVAGGGPLPRLVAEAAVAAGREVFTLGFSGITDPETPADRLVPLGALGRALVALREAGVDDVVLVGPVPRPRLADLQPDLRAIRLVARIAQRRIGDDAALRAVIAEIEAQGHRVVGADAVAPCLVAPLGPLAGRTADVASLRDLAIGIEACSSLGDAGQAVLVRRGEVIGREDRGGTDRMLSAIAPGDGGVMVKMAKPCQDRRVDLPTIGPQTVELAAARGLRGLFVEAGATLLIDRRGIAERADGYGLFVVGVPPR
jgi:DUF1009 family protein